MTIAPPLRPDPTDVRPLAYKGKSAILLAIYVIREETRLEAAVSRPMRTLGELRKELLRLDGRGYKAYKAIAGTYGEARFTLFVDHVQGDPFAEPSRIRVLVPAHVAGFPPWAFSTEGRRVSAADFLNRRLHRELGRVSGRRGSGRSGEFRILRPGQEVLRRTSLVVRDGGEVEARFRIGLPAAGRRILGRQAAELICEDLPRCIEGSLVFEALDERQLRRHAEVVEDAQALREQLQEHGLVAFVGDGAILPRLSGVDDRPLGAEEAMPFRSPESLRVSLETPNSGLLTGMGIPMGVTLIVGGGYHGKSTLLRAIERGVYDHVPGDGRDRVATVEQAVKIRAEDGRRVAGTDISPFISGLPGGEDTRRFRTENASGSTSQAANIIEALEVGARCLLLDEDTSATNFMIRDARMQELVASEHEPITPFIDRARQLADELEVSTILVVGGAGDYFDVADTVIAMRAYQPEDVTSRARDIARRLPGARQREGGPWPSIRGRIPVPQSIDPSRGRKDISIKTRTEDRVLFGNEEVELSSVEQIVELAQTRAIASVLAWARNRSIDGRRDMRESLQSLIGQLQRNGLEGIERVPAGDFAGFRIFELAAFLNRLRSLEVRSENED